jgi:phospholipid transport system substrate-binding protein
MAAGDKTMLNITTTFKISFSGRRSAALAMAIALMQTPIAQAATPTEMFVQRNIDQAYAILNNSVVSVEQRTENFRQLLVRIVDAKRIARFTLGPYARGASQAQIDNFESVFSDFVATVFQHEIAGSPGEKITVTNSTVRAADDVIVAAKLTGSARSNAPVDIAFRVRRAADGSDSILDLQVEGVWIALAQREDFSNWLQQHHADISALTAELKKHTEGMMDGVTTARNGAPASARP